MNEEKKDYLSKNVEQLLKYLKKYQQKSIFVGEKLSYIQDLKDFAENIVVIAKDEENKLLKELIVFVIKNIKNNVLTISLDEFTKSFGSGITTDSINFSTCLARAICSVAWFKLNRNGSIIEIDNPWLNYIGDDYKESFLDEESYLLHAIHRAAMFPYREKGDYIMVACGEGPSLNVYSGSDGKNPSLVDVIYFNRNRYEIVSLERPEEAEDEEYDEFFSN